MKKKSVGVWGYGRVGKAAVKYFLEQQFSVEVLNKTKLSSLEQKQLAHHKVTVHTEEKNRDRFFLSNEFLLASPGINITKYYQKYYYKWISELDLFYLNFKKPIIAITGSIGKTSITHLLGSILKNLRLNIAIGGNIGTPMLSLLSKKNYSAALLELSSFQLEFCRYFSPHLAIWTNFIPNHLDRHKTIEQYFQAKLPIILHQNKHQIALIPLALKNKIKSYFKLTQKVAYFCDHRPSDFVLRSLKENEVIYFVHHNVIVRYEKGYSKPMLALNHFPPITFPINWLIICSALDLLSFPTTHLATFAQTLSIPEHRLEHVGTFNLIDYYNDSKSTTPASTLAAVSQLQDKPIRLLFGGLSKGVDRAPCIKSLKNNVVKIYCFGAEAIKLNLICKQFDILSSVSSTLEEALNLCAKEAQPHEQILLSPAGASYDLYNNYEERGNHFKHLVYDYYQK